MDETTTNARACRASTFARAIHGRRAIHVILLVAGLLALGPSVARADRSKALALYERGTIAYNLRDFRAAITHYEAAYKEYPAPEFLFNIAQSYRQLDDCEQAVHFYKRYLALKPDAEERREVEGRIADLEARCKDRSVILEKPPEGTQAPAREPARGDGEPRTATTSSGPTRAERDDDAAATRAAQRTGASPTQPSDAARSSDLTAAENHPRAPADLSSGTGVDRPTRHVLFVLAEGGITQLAIGDSSTVQPSVRAGIGFGVTEGDLEIAIGPVVTWAQLPWVRGPLEGRVSHIGLLAEVALRYRVLRSLSLRAEAGGGAAVLTGLSAGDPFLANGATRTSLALFALRGAVGVDVDLTDTFCLSITPFALTWSPANDDLGATVSAVRRIDAAAGLGLRF
ncbi:tetratricopeptide repeat protein [Myxococcota bacterium]|nr:tetratricopeptide repeat protein [Myxococcota bacterium]